MPDYKPVPVEAAKQIAQQFDKSQVIIVTFDPLFRLLHRTSYGVSAMDKVAAAHAADEFVRSTGAEPRLRQTHEDFRRDFDAAQFKQVLELLATIQEQGGCSPVDLAIIDRLLQDRAEPSADERRRAAEISDATNRVGSSQETNHEKRI